MAEDTINTGILSCQFIFICFGFLQANFNTILIFELFPSRLQDCRPIANYLQPVLLTIGSIAGGLLLRFGRRKCAIFADIPITLAGILSLLMKPEALLGARIIMDLTRGAVFSIYVIYFKEMAPKIYVGLSVCMVLCVSDFSTCVVTFLEAIFTRFGMDLDNDTHKVTIIQLTILFTGLLMCQAHFVVGLFAFKNESPRYLMEDQKKEEAYAIISLIYKNMDSANDELNFIQEASEFRQFKTVTWKSIFSSKNRGPLLICCFFMLMRYTAGGQSYWSFMKGETNEEVTIIDIIHALCAIAPAITGILFERINLRRFMMIGLLIGAITNTIAWIFGLIDYKAETAPYYLALVFTTLSSITSSLTVAPIALLLSVQLLPDKGTALAATCMWLSAFAMILPFYIRHPVVPQYLYMQPIYVGFSVLGCVVSFFLLHDTTGTDEKTLKKAYLKRDY